MKNRFVLLGVLLCLVLAPAAAQARLMRDWTLGSIVNEAKVIAVGRVTEITVAGKIAPEDTRWKTALLRKQAKVEVLRSFSQVGSPQLPAGKPISVSYLSTDPDQSSVFVNGPMFAGLAVGDTLAFPLSSTTADGSSWQLIDEEAARILLPCVKDPIEDARPQTPTTFLEREMAGSFVNGTIADMAKAGEYDHFIPGNSLDAVCQLIIEHVKDDQARWLQIAAAVYTDLPLQSVPGAADPGNTRRAKISELLATPEKWDSPRAILAEKALRHAGAKDLDSRIITTSIKDLMGIAPWGVGVTISTNYRGDPLVTKLLGQALAQDKPGALEVAQYVIKDKKDPLISTAIPAAVKGVQKAVVKPGAGPAYSVWYGSFRSACSLILNYGDDKANSALLNEIERARKSDPDRYRDFWQACGYVDAKRATEIMRIYIDDDTVLFRDVTYADMAASMLARITGDDFGAAKAKTRSDRDAVVQRAREWLKLHPASPNPL